MNPRYKSFEDRSTNQIHNTNLLKTGLRIESTIQIFWKPCRFTNPNPKNSYGFVLFIIRLSTKDLSGFVRIHWIRENRSNLWNLTGFVIHDSKWIFLSPDSWSMMWYKSGICIIRHKLNLFGVQICDRDTVQVHGFAKQIHEYTIPWYNSYILIQMSFEMRSIVSITNIREYFTNSRLLDITKHITCVFYLT